jgi:hypothetical protein
LFCFIAAPGPSGSLAATGRTLHDCRRHVKSVSHTACELRKRRLDGVCGTPGNGEAPVG